MLCVNKSAQLCLAENGPGDPPPGKPPFHTFNRDVTRDIKAGDQPLFSLFHSLSLCSSSTTHQQSNNSVLPAAEAAGLLSKCGLQSSHPSSQQRFKDLLKTKI